jgi:cytidylate kinase
MAIVMISGFAQSGKDELADGLAGKTGWPLVSRDDLVESARDRGIRIGRLEVSVIKHPSARERLSREKNLYLAFLTTALCERAVDGNLIYSGRTGHLLLPGVSHRLRVGLTQPREVRVQRAARELNISQQKADQYLSGLDEDFEKWARFVHRVDAAAPGQFDLFLNLENLGLSNAAGILCEMAELADFRPTPASRKRVADLQLAARARLDLAFDPRTADADLQVQANGGVLTVTYTPAQRDFAGAIPDVLAEVPGCQEIRCTMAETSILWVQERFNAASESYEQISSLAQRWGAAIELMRLLPQGASDAASAPSPDTLEQTPPARPYHQPSPDGGVEDDEPRPLSDDGGLRETQEELVGLGRSGGQNTVRGGSDEIAMTSEGHDKYSLVVVGDVFLSKDQSARKRMTRELALDLRDRLKAPVITSDELGSEFTVSARHAVKFVGHSSLVLIALVLVLTHQAEVLDFLGGALHARMSWLTAAAVVVFVPVFAFLYGSVTQLALRLLRIE